MVITIDSAFEKDKKQYPQVFLKESKYVENEKKKKKKWLLLMSWGHINYELEIYSHDSDKE